MRNAYTMMAFLGLVFSACADALEVDRDGVPKVDIHGHIVVDKPASKSNGWDIPEHRVRLISVGDHQIPIGEFYRKYCAGKFANGTCDRAHKIISIDSSSGPIEKLPSGL